MTRVFFKDVKVNCIANTCATDHKVKTGLAIQPLSCNPARLTLFCICDNKIYIMSGPIYMKIKRK
jgi:hypothetical protein